MKAISPEGCNGVRRQYGEHLFHSKRTSRGKVRTVLLHQTLYEWRGCFFFFLSGRCHLVSVLMCASTPLFAESPSAGGTARERKYMKMTAFNVAAENEVNDHD